MQREKNAWPPGLLEKKKQIREFFNVIFDVYTHVGNRERARETKVFFVGRKTWKFHSGTTRAMCVKIMWKGCEKCVKKRNHVKSMLAKIQVHHISISHACELFDMRVKFCNTCEKILSYVWTFFHAFYYMWNFFTHVKQFCHACELQNFTCIIDAMLVKFFTCIWTLLGMSEWACEFFQGLLNATTMNHIFMKMPWISSEYPMKTAKLNFMPLSLAMNFLWKGNFLLYDSWILCDQRFMGPELSMKTCHRVFHGPWNHGTRLSRN